MANPTIIIRGYDSEGEVYISDRNPEYGTTTTELSDAKRFATETDARDFYRMHKTVFAWMAHPGIVTISVNEID